MKKLLLLISSLSLVGCEHLPPELSALQSALQKDVAAPGQAKASPVEEVRADGLTAWLVEDKSLPLVSMQLLFKGAGSSSDPAGKKGRSMFASALLDEGSGELSALAFQQALDDKAIRLSFHVDEDVLVVQLKSLSEHLPSALELLGNALTKPSFNAKDIERKRATALSKLNQAKSNPGFVLSERFNALAYVGHPYSTQSIGNEDGLSAISKTDLRNYVDQALTKDRLLISATGDVSAEVLKNLMTEHLAGLPETSLMPMPMDIVLKHQGVLSIAEMDIPQSHVLVASPAIDRTDERFLAAYVLNHIIGGDTLTSVLGVAIREKKGLAYSVSSYLDPMSHSSNFKVRFATRNEQVAEAYDTLKEELATLAKNGVSQGQFEAALDYITGSFVLSLDNNANYTRYLNSMQRYDLGKDYLQTRNQKMRAVTIEEVNKLAAEILDPDKWLTVVVGKPEKLESGPKVTKIK